jgi:hypothetical protein
MMLLTSALVSSAAAAGTPGPLAPGLVAGIKQAQLQKSVLLTALGTGVVIAAIVIIATDESAATTIATASTRP